MLSPWLKSQKLVISKKYSFFCVLTSPPKCSGPSRWSGWNQSSQVTSSKRFMLHRAAFSKWAVLEDFPRHHNGRGGLRPMQKSAARPCHTLLVSSKHCCCLSRRKLKVTCLFRMLKRKRWWAVFQVCQKGKNVEVTLVNTVLSSMLRILMITKNIFRMAVSLIALPSVGCFVTVQTAFHWNKYFICWNPHKNKIPLVYFSVLHFSEDKWIGFVA